MNENCLNIEFKENEQPIIVELTTISYIELCLLYASFKELNAANSHNAIGIKISYILDKLRRELERRDAI